LKIGGANVSEVTVYKKAAKEQADKIISLDLGGVYLSTDIERIYPYGELLSQTLGFISSDNAGQAGLEKYYDKYLKGLEGRVLTESDLT
jgi:stage V sporulation protein D (sporulation-specific penicillin-binding protein)